MMPGEEENMKQIRKKQIYNYYNERAKTREKSDFQKRTLNNGREFIILKKYYAPEDIKNIFSRYNIELEAVYPGKVFITGIGTI